MAEFVDKWQAVSNLVYAGLVDAQKAVDAIQYMPPADVRPVIHGKWHLNRDGSGICSECGRTQYNCWDLDNWDNFCHFCGADMRMPLKGTKNIDKEV